MSGCDAHVGCQKHHGLKRVHSEAYTNRKFLKNGMMGHFTLDWMAVSPNTALGFSRMHASNVSFLGYFQKAVEGKFQIPQQHIQ